MIQSCESQVSNLDLTGSSDENIGRLEVPVNDPVVMEIRNTIEELPEEGLENWDRQSRPR